MAAKRITNINIDWTALAERVPEHQKALFVAFKTKSDGYLRRLMAFPEQPPKIDWAYYENRVPIKGMVADFQKQYNALAIPYPKDTLTPLIEAQEKEEEKRVKAFIQESNLRIAEYEAEIKRLQSLLPYGQMTMEDFADAHPDLALNPVDRPTFWPHDPEDQLDYKPADQGQSGH